MILNSVCLADDGAKPVTKGSTVPYDGVLLTVPKANELHSDIVVGDGYKKLNDSLNQSLTIQQNNYNIEQQKNTILDARNDKLAEQLKNAQSMNNTEKLLWMGVGVLVTGASAYTLSKIHK